MEMSKRSKDSGWIAHRFSCLGIQEDEHKAIGELLVKHSLEKSTFKTVMFKISHDFLLSIQLNLHSDVPDPFSVHSHNALL